MQFPEARSKVKVTVTQGWYVTLLHPKMHPNTKFGISTSINIRDIILCYGHNYSKNNVRGQGHPKMVYDTLLSQDASTHQIWNSYLKEYWRYAPDTKTDRPTNWYTRLEIKWLKKYGDACFMCLKPLKRQSQLQQTTNFATSFSIFRKNEV